MNNHRIVWSCLSALIFVAAVPVASHAQNPGTFPGIPGPSKTLSEDDLPSWMRLGLDESSTNADDPRQEALTAYGFGYEAGYVDSFKILSHHLLTEHQRISALHLNRRARIEEVSRSSTELCTRLQEQFALRSRQLAGESENNRLPPPAYQSTASGFSKGYGDATESVIDDLEANMDKASAGLFTEAYYRAEIQQKVETALFAEAQRTGLTPGAALKAFERIKFE